MVDISKLLGDDAEALLGYEASGIPSDRLTLPGSDFIERTMMTSNRSPQVLRSLASLYNHGRLGGTGYV